MEFRIIKRIEIMFQMKKSSPCCPKFILILIYLVSTFPTFGQFTLGNTYYDSTGFVEYRAGNLPIIISAPHGGDLEPDSIPDRDCAGCTTVKDAWTKPIAEGLYDAFFEQTGCYPHVVINLLHRKKFDANRDIIDAADGNSTVEKAWRGYHSFIDSAKNKIVLENERGLFLDIHGHGHPIQRIELGYLLSGSELRLSDEILNTVDLIEESSIQTLVDDNLPDHDHATLLRGAESFGTLMTDKGFPSVPSQADPFPMEGEPYFSGGYNTVRHGSRDNAGGIDAIQIELNQEIRFDETNRIQLIDSLTHTVNQYLNFYYNDLYLENFCNQPTSIFETNFPIDLEIFPNPAADFFSLKTEWTDIEISIYNLLGQKIKTEIWQGSAIEIGDLERGCYFIRMKKEGRSFGSWKLMKE